MEEDMNMMDVSEDVQNGQQQPSQPPINTVPQSRTELVLPPLTVQSSPIVPATPSISSSRERFRDIAVKVHIRRPGKDTWHYLGRAFASQEVIGQSSRVVVRAAASDKILASFSETSNSLAEKRGNFVIVGCVDQIGVVSWSFNAANNNETLRLLASIELACYKVKHILQDPSIHAKLRRRIERTIREDRRKRHMRRRDDEQLAEAFGQQRIS